MLRGRPAPPFWFQLLFGVTSACLLRVVVERFDAGAADVSPASDVHHAFWFLVGLIASWVWTGVQVAAKITLQILAWSVKLLWAFAVAVSNAATAIGKALVTGFRKAWDFTRWTYDTVLKPAWQQFWKFVDWARTMLETIFQPILNFLDKIRTYVLDFYNAYVRPILDVIGFARRVLSILASFGLEWARALDRKLAELEAKIQLPFTLVIGKLNEITNIINRVVTLDGLFQRLALIRSLQRDVRLVMNVWWNSSHRTATPEEIDRATTAPETKTFDEHLAETRGIARRHAGELTGRIDEEVYDLKLMLRRT